VDAALRNADRLDYMDDANTCTLAAEVRALRLELKQAYDLANYPDAAEFRPDACFARGFRQGRKEALCEFHSTSVCAGCEHYKQLADMNEYAAELLDAQEDVERLESENERLLAAETDLAAANAELRKQLVAARSMLQECTHERVDPKRDPFGGMGT
jgi:hypothetical protein